MIEKPKDHVDNVLDPYEVAELLAVLVIGIVRLKERDLLVRLDRGEDMGDDRLLSPLMIFIRTIDVKEFQSDELFGVFPPAARTAAIFRSINALLHP